MDVDRFSATYLLETTTDIDAAAAALAGESSTATFIKLPGAQAERIDRQHRARVERVVDRGEAASPSLPVARLIAGPVRRAEVTLSWPLANTGPSLPSIMATVAGNISELREVTGLRLLDLDLPPALSTQYSGPQFGIDGTRKLTGVQGRPLIGTIIKPSIGLTPAEKAELVDKLVVAGIDFIKDDELMADPPHCPFAERVKAVMAVIRRHADRTGRKVMFAFNITGEIDDMLARHDIVAAEGGTCIMLSLNWVSTVGVARVRRHSTLAIHGHRNGWGFLSRHPALGFEFCAWHKPFRLAGIDHVHVNGLGNKFAEADESVIRSAKSCLQPLWGDSRPAHRVMPIFSSGQTVRQVAATHAAIKSIDLIYAAGGGILAHPDGIAAGVAALRQAWEAAVADTPVGQHANAHAELRRALETFRA